VYEALVSLAVFAGYREWAAILIIAWNGLGRYGEVLNALRDALLLPVDLLSGEADRGFLAVRSPETGRRGGGQDPALAHHRRP